MKSRGARGRVWAACGLGNPFRMAPQTFGVRVATRMAFLDPLGERLQPTVRRWLSSSLPLRNLLDGTWLGVPLHPALTDVPLGASTTALLLDLAETVAPRRRAHAADEALAVCVLTSVAAAATGVADWRDLQGLERRVGLAHGALNGTAFLLNASSLFLRSLGRRGTGKAASALAFALSSTAAHIGGELSFGSGVRVNHTAWEGGTGERFRQVLDAGELQPGELRGVEVEGVSVLVARSFDGSLCALSATCSHQGGPLAEGRFDGTTVTCPWHGSRFDLASGEVVVGPAVFAQPRYEAREHAGKIELRRAPEPA